MKKFFSAFLALFMLSLFFVSCKPAATPVAETPTQAASQAASAPASEAPAVQGETPEALDKLHAPFEEPVAINIVLGYRNPESPDTPENITPETATAVKRFKTDLNIELNYTWIVNADQYNEKFGAELAAGNLPDIMFLSPNSFEDLYSQGGLLEIGAVYEEYRNEAIDLIVNYDDKIIKGAMRDGGLYGLPMSTHPAQSAGDQTFYRMDMLKKAGIEKYEDLPKTIAEMEALLEKLYVTDLGPTRKVGDPLLPASKHYIDSGLGDFSPVFHAYESWGSGWYDDGTGTLQYAGISENHKAPLTLLNAWYNKGYFEKDFAALDVWSADSKVVSDIVAGKFPIIFGSWWIPNWPLNDHKKNEPDAEWVAGPTLTLDAGLPTTLTSRYPINNLVACSRDFKYPEAIFKMMQWSLDFSRDTENPEFLKNATQEELLEKNSHVYIWLPFRTHSPSTLVDNYRVINELNSKSITEIAIEDAPINNEFWGVWSNNLRYLSGDKDPVVWGNYTSRVFPDAGVGRMVDLYENSKKMYDEVYVTTPTMISRQGEMDKLRDTTFLSMIMGETSIDQFDQYVASWRKLGGDEVGAEVNAWYDSQK